MAPELTTATRPVRALTTIGCLIALTVGAALAAVPQRARAAEPTDQPPALEVSYGDLDLTTERGAQTLLHRIREAARTVCPLEDISNLAAFSASRRCERQAVARAVARVGSPRLAALYSPHPRHG